MKRLLLGCLLTVFVVTVCGVQVGVAADDKKPDLDKVFARLDKDSDGKLSETEFVGKREGDKAEKAKKQFARLDKDSDGSVTLAEFKDRKKKKDS